MRDRHQGARTTHGKGSVTMPWITELKHEKPDGSIVRKFRVGAYRNDRRQFKTFTNKKDAKVFAKTLGDVPRNKDCNLSVHVALARGASLHRFVTNRYLFLDDTKRCVSNLLKYGAP